MRGLYACVYSIWKAISQADFTDYYQTLTCIALAALIQFHFVDQHPFIDGNGRMCRILNKVILDWVLPVPIPMFDDRNEYIQSLVEGRQEELAVNCPQRLMKLLLKSAINHYTDMIKASTELVFDVLIVASSADQLNVKLSEIGDKLDNADKKNLCSAFEQLEQMHHVDVSTEHSLVIRIYRHPAFCFDEISFAL